MSNPRDAILLLNELHKERLNYEEYTLLIDCIHKLQNDNKELENQLTKIAEAVMEVLDAKKRTRK